MAHPLIHSLQRQAWALAGAVAALLLLLGVALYSPDRQKGLTEFEAVGPMRHIETAAVVALRIEVGQRQWDLERRATGWHMVQGGAPVDATTSDAVEMGLRLLHNSPPERGFDTESSDFGLTPTALRIHLSTNDGASFEADFGGANATGLARYVRIREPGRSALHLMSGYVVEPWEQVAGSLRK
jgi:hypothetical protein